MQSRVVNIHSVVDFCREINIEVVLGFHGEPTSFAPAFPNVLAATLAKISTATHTRLDKISTNIPRDRAPLFEAAFADHKLTFPGVRKLAVTQSNDFMIKRCPNVVAMSLTGFAHGASQPEGRETLETFDKLCGIPTLDCLLFNAHYSIPMMNGTLISWMSFNI